MVLRPAIALLASLLLGAATAAVQAQTSPARGPAAPPPTEVEDTPMPDYLGLLEQIAPAARRGAEAYREAFQLRCGRPLTVAELRRAVAEQDGDPVLMQMIRASYLEDREALGRLAAEVPCRREPRS